MMKWIEAVVQVALWFLLVAGLLAGIGLGAGLIARAFRLAAGI